MVRWSFQNTSIIDMYVSFFSDGQVSCSYNKYLDKELCQNETCPNGCSCDGRKYKCQSSSLQYISPTIPHIDISGHPLDINVMCKFKYPILVYLNLSRTDIDNLFCFSGIYFFRLRILDLSGNKFHVIRDLSFPALEVLHLQNNPIRILEALSISKRNIAFKIEYAEWITNLQTVSFAAANITNIQLLPVSGGNGMTISFEEHLRENSSDIMPVKIECFLTDIDLSFNRLASFQNFGYCTFLMTINLRRNEIKTLSYDTFNGMSNLRNIYLSHNKLEAVNNGDLRGLTRVTVLLLDNNLISVLHPRSLSDLQRLLVLRLDNNHLRTLNNRTFYNLRQMKSLNLSNNLLDEIDIDIFESNKELLYLGLQNNRISSIVRARKTLGKLQNLNLEKNRIKYISAGIFESLPNLLTLNLRGNDIVPHKDMFSGLGLLHTLYVNSFTLCCFRPISVHSENCVSPSSIFSSCTDLIELGFLHIFIWFTAAFSVFGNIKSLAYRFRSGSWKNESRDILTSNLSLSDLCMGIYLIIIAYEDLRTRGAYGEFHNIWQKSLLCKVAGVIMTMSCQMSTLCIFGVTFDRLVIFRYPFIDREKVRHYASAAIITMWIFSITVAVLPELHDYYFGIDFYGRSSVCISLPLTSTTLTYEGWEYSFALFIVLNLIIYCLVVVGQMAILLQIRAYDSCGQNEAKRKREVAVAKSLSVVVISDSICWLPIAILGKRLFY